MRIGAAKSRIATLKMSATTLPAFIEGALLVEFGPGKERPPCQSGEKTVSEERGDDDDSREAGIGIPARQMRSRWENDEHVLHHQSHD